MKPGLLRLLTTAPLIIVTNVANADDLPASAPPFG